MLKTNRYAVKYSIIGASIMITSMLFSCLLLNTVRARLDFLVVNTEYFILEIPLDPQDMD